MPWSSGASLKMSFSVVWDSVWFVFWFCGFFFPLNLYINTVCFINKCCIVHLAYVVRSHHSTVCMAGRDTSEICFMQQITVIMDVFMYKIPCTCKFQNCLKLADESKRELKGCRRNAGISLWFCYSKNKPRPTPARTRCFFSIYQCTSSCQALFLS